MSFKLFSILELYGSERGRNEKDDDGFEGGVSSSAANGIGQTAATENRVLSFVHIAEENFLLVVLLSSEANLMVYYSTGAKLSRNGAVSIPQLFPNQKLPSPPALVALTEDASVVAVLLADSHNILLIPFGALMDVTWGRQSTPLVSKPGILCIAETQMEEMAMEDGSNSNNGRPTTALCFHSRLAQRTFLLFGNTGGQLFLVDLHLKRVSVRIDLRTGIRSMRVLNQNDGQKLLLVTQIDWAQLILPLESQNVAIREQLARIDPADICLLDQQIHFFPQKTGCCALLNKRIRSLSLHKSLDLCHKPPFDDGDCADQIVRLDRVPSGVDIEQLMFARWMVVALTARNRLLVHFRFLQPSYEQADFSPIQVEACAEPVKILGLIYGGGQQQFGPSEAVNGDGHEEADDQQQLDLATHCLVVTERGLHWLRPEKSMPALILDHLCAHQYASDSLASLAQTLRTNAQWLCLSLLRHLLKSSSSKPSSLAQQLDDKVAAQVEGMLSLAFVYNVKPQLLLSLLQECGQTDLLLPFLTLKCERSPQSAASAMDQTPSASSSSASLHQLLLSAMLAKLEHISTGHQPNSNGGDEAISTSLENGGGMARQQQQQRREADRNAMEHELRRFLLKFGIIEREVLPLLLRHSLWSCVCVLLSRNPHEHSAPVARFLLELPVWKSLPRVGGLLRCLSFLHWPSLDAYTPTLAVRMFNLVPFLDAGQLRVVNQIADNLLNCSVDSALSLKLATLSRLLGLTMGNAQQTSAEARPTRRPLACGSNCSLALAEDDIGGTDTQNLPMGQENHHTGTLQATNGGQPQQISHQRVDQQPLFWGEFAAGTIRLTKEEPMASAQPQLSTSAESASKRRKQQQEPEHEAAEKKWRQEKAEESQRQLLPNAQRKQQSQLRETLRQQRQNQFPAAAVPRPVQLPDRIQIRSVACGTEHVLLLSADGRRLFTWGRNRFGQCGVGHRQPIPTPMELRGEWGGEAAIVDICAGHYHSAVLTANNEVWLWGWAMHGQLGDGKIEDRLVPTRNAFFSSLGPIKSICLGYAHTLVLAADGRVFGCGATANGQLGLDPAQLTGNPQKMPWPIQLPFPSPISLVASAYFHGIALSMDGGELFEWGECPQTLKMRMFLQKRLRSKEQQQKQPQIVKEPKKENPSRAEVNQIGGEEEKNMDSSKSANGTGAGGGKRPTAAPIEMSRQHFRIRRLCRWEEQSAVQMLSAGFNHSALLTMDGELYTWGKALEMQLGQGTRKERTQPTQVQQPAESAAKWADVVCARNFTAALSTEGLLFVWGRNDRNQLGIGSAAAAQKKQQQPIRRILLKSEKGKPQRAIELPADNCVEKPTMLAGLRVPVPAELAPPTEAQLSALLASADQHSIGAVSRFLVRYPVPAFVAVQAHLMAGDLVPAIRLLAEIAQRERLMVEEQGKQDSKTALADGQRQVTVIAKVVSRNGSESRQQQSPIRKTPSSARIGTVKIGGPPAADHNASPPPTTAAAGKASTATAPIGRVVSVQLRRVQRTQSPASSAASPPTAPADGTFPSAATSATTFAADGIHQSPLAFGSSTASDSRNSSGRVEQFHGLVDRLWALLRMHPLREVQTVALVEMLHARFPVYNRLAADLHLCRLVEPFLALPAAPSNALGSSMAKKFSELAVRERHAALRVAHPPDLGSRRFGSLKGRCEQMLAQDRLRYFADCGHFEKCVVESGPIRSELASLRNRMRRCTRCVHSRRSSGGTRASSESVP